LVVDGTAETCSYVNMVSLFRNLSFSVVLSVEKKPVSM
jgi:hypothetical protein